MRLKTFVVFAFTLLSTFSLQPATASAQEPPKTEVFAGYSHFLASSQSAGDLNGWNASAAWNVNRRFAVEADASGYYGDGDSIHSLMGGGKFTWRYDHFNPYVHALGGFVVDTHGDGIAIGAAAVGGGLDVVVNRRLSVRAFQVDYFPLFGNRVVNNARVSTGIVLTF